MEEAMEVDLSPKSPTQAYSGDGGSYHIWQSSKLPMLGEANVGAAKLVLEPRGLALPHYADSFKIGYVLEGSGRAGLVFPGAAKEKVVKLKKGIAMAIPFGVVSWWFNDGESELVAVFLGDTSKAFQPGLFSYLFLTGTNAIFTGFSMEFIKRAWDLDEEEANKLMKSQSGSLIVKVKDGLNMAEPNEVDGEGTVFNCNNAQFDVDVKNGGRVVVLTSTNLPLLGEIGFGANLVKLDPNAMCSPGYSSDSAFQVTYIVRGSGRVEIVGTDGHRVLETRVSAGSLFIVPRFFVVSKIADGEGMEWFSIITAPQPVFSHLAGKTAVWKALSPQVLEASLNVDPDIEKIFRSKRSTDAIFFPPPN